MGTKRRWRRRRRRRTWASPKISSIASPLDRYLMPPEIKSITRRPPIPIQRSRELLHHRFAFVFPCVYILWILGAAIVLCGCRGMNNSFQLFRHQLNIVFPLTLRAGSRIPPISHHCLADDRRFQKLLSLQIKTNSQLVKPTFFFAGINRSCPQITPITKKR